MLQIKIIYRYIYKFLRPAIAAFVKSQPPINITSSKHFRYSNSIKQFALKIHFLGPKVYRILRIPWALPSPRTLQRVTEKWEFSPGFNDLLFKILEMKGSTMTPKNKECVLCVDEMSVKAFLYYHTVKDRIIGFHNTNSVKTYEYAKAGNYDPWFACYMEATSLFLFCFIHLLRLRFT